MRQKKAQNTLKKVKETYNHIAAEFSATRMTLRHDFEHYSRYFKEGQKIVDLGCGNGRLFKLLNEYLKDFDYTGIDNSDALLTEAHKNFSEAKFVLGDQLEIPLPDEFCDILCNIRTFHHIPTKKLQQKSLEEMKRVLKPNGLLIVTCWNFWNKRQFKYMVKAGVKSIINGGQTSYKDTLVPWGEDQKNASDETKKNMRYYYAFTFKELKKIIEKSGFTIIESKKLQDLIIIAHNGNRPKILDIPFYNLSKKEALEKVLKTSKPLFIATPNPEMLLEARKNETFKKILQQTDLNIPDGFGIMLASRIMGKPLKARITGTDFLQEICKNAPHGTKIFLLGAATGVAEKTKSQLQKKFPNIIVVGTHSGSPALHEDQNIRQLINSSQAQMLFVAYGAPKQELWIARNLPRLTHIKVAMGVGGAFDFISGTVKRAPNWMRKLGIEWLYRLAKQPSRIGRIFNATIKFPLIFICSLLKK